MAAQGASAYAAVPTAPPAPSVSQQQAAAPLPHPTDLKTVQAQQAAAVAAAAAQQQQTGAQQHPQQPQVGGQTQHGVPVPLPHPHAVAQVAQMAGPQAAFAYPANMVFAAPDQGLIDDQPTYVNPKQYARILKRRESRKKQTGTDVTSYTPRKRSYMHESRHKHAMQRRRGPGGRFLSKQERAEIGKAAERAAAAGSTGGGDSKDAASGEKES